MNCDRIDERTADYLGDELDSEARAEFETHLQQCEACRANVAELARTRSVLQSLDTVDHEAAKALTRHLRIVRLAPLGTRLGFGLLKAAAVLALGVFLGYHLQNTDHDANKSPFAGNQNAVVHVAGVHPRWLALAERLGTEPDSLADQLRLLAASRKQ